MYARVAEREASFRWVSRALVLQKVFKRVGIEIPDARADAVSSL